MGTICILFGLIIFLGSILGGFALTNYLVTSTFAQALVSVIPNEPRTYIVVVSVCGFIGLLICLNLVMHGLTYNQLCKIERERR